MTIKEHLWELLDSLKECDISGWRLFDMMYSRTGKKTYPSKLLDYCREYASISGAIFSCVDHKKSKYHYTPGIKISGGILD
jgi:hypothetical protein